MNEIIAFVFGAVAGYCIVWGRRDGIFIDLAHGVRMRSRAKRRDVVRRAVNVYRAAEDFVLGQGCPYEGDNTRCQQFGGSCEDCWRDRIREAIES